MSLPDALAQAGEEVAVGPLFPFTLFVLTNRKFTIQNPTARLVTRLELGK